jgi:hypothetical protein
VLARVAKLGSEIMPAHARTTTFEMRRPKASESIGGCDHKAPNCCANQLAGRHSLFVASAGDDDSLIGNARDPFAAIVRLSASLHSKLRLQQVWWCGSAEAAIVHVAFAACVWPIYELVPSVLVFAREHGIELTADRVMLPTPQQQKAVSHP